MDTGKVIEEMQALTAIQGLEKAAGSAAKGPSARKTILIIDDSDNIFTLRVEKIFGDTFNVVRERSGVSGIEYAVKKPPDVILLDIEMPEMNGFDVCRALKDRNETADVPVIFISAHTDLENRLNSYEAGGDAYLSKPPASEELARKIAVVLRNRKRNAELAQRISAASTLVRQASETASDARQIMEFMREIAGYTSYVQIAEAGLRFLARLSLECAIQLRTKSGSISRNNNGFCAPLEEQVMHTMQTCGSRVTFGKRAAFNCERVTVIINNMPAPGSDVAARVEDSVMVITEALEQTMRSLELTFDAITRGDTLLGLLHKNASILREVQAHNQEQRGRSSEILNQLVYDIEDSFIFLGLSESQEDYLQNLARDAVDKAQKLYNNSIERDAIMRFDAVMHSLGEDLEDTLRQEIQGAADAAAEVESRIELF